MNLIKTLEERISEALYPSSSDNVVLDPPTDDQVTQQSSQGTGHNQCSQTEFGEVCVARPDEESPQQAVSQGTKGVAADTAADRLSTEFGEVRLVHQPESAGSQSKESGAPPSDSNTKAAEPAHRQQPDRTKQGVPATPPSTPQASMSSNEQGHQNQQGTNPLRPSIRSATKEVRGGSASQPQGDNREHRPICSSKTFTTVVDQPLEKEIIEVIREHRFYEKKFVVETRPAGERELTDRQNEEEVGTRVVMGRVTAPSSPCEKAPQLAVHGR